MGTNFYYSKFGEKIHIGKRSHPKYGLEFIWAVNPEILLNNNLKNICDEYGKKYTIEQFKKIISECKCNVYSIGTIFS